MNSIDDRLTELESALEDQQARIEAHEETIAAQQATIEAQRERLAAVENGGGVSMPMSRRGALAAGGALGLLGLGAGTASAEGVSPSGRVGTAERPLEAVHAQTVKFAEGDDSDTQITSNDDGTFLEFSLGVYEPALTLENTGEGTPNVIAGSGHEIEGIVIGVTIGGGEFHAISGEAIEYSTISGGNFNGIETPFATIGGGESNNIRDLGAGGTISGGQNNEVTRQSGTISGGSGNKVTGEYATVGGGESNEASGDYSFVVGRDATAEANGSFVVADGTDTEFDDNSEPGAYFQLPLSAEELTLTGDNFDGDFSIIGTEEGGDDSVIGVVLDGEEYTIPLEQANGGGD